MKVGDLVEVKSADDEFIHGTGTYLGIETTWKDWHMVYIIHPWYLTPPDFRGTPFDEPYWVLEVIDGKDEC